CGYKKDNCELNYKFLNNLQSEWKQYGTLIRQTKNLIDINIDALYNILKQNQGDMNDALGYKKKVVVITSDPLALVAEKIKVVKRKEKVIVSSDSKGSGADDFSELKNITALLAKALNRRKFYSKLTNNNLRASSTSQSTNKKQEFVKSDDKKEDKKADEKKRDMSKVKCYNCKKEGHFAKDCKKVKVEDYNYYKTKMLLAKKDIDEQVLLVKEQAWMESISDSDQEINANMVFMAQIEKVLSKSDESSSSPEETIAEIADQEVLFAKMSVEMVELDKHVRDLKNTGLKKDFKISKLKECVCNKDLEIEKCLECLNVCENKLHKIGQTNQTVHMIMPSKDNLYNGRKGIGFENPSYFEKAKDLKPTLYDEKVIGLGYTLMFLSHFNEALEIEKFKRSRQNKIEFAYDYGNLNASYVNEKINFLDDYFQEIINPDFENIDSPFQQKSSLKPYVSNVILEKIIIDLEDEVVSLLEKEKANLKTIVSLKSKGYESSENAISKSENQSENDCLVTEKERDKVENPKNGENLDTFNSVRRPKHSGVIWKKKGSSNTSNANLSFDSLSNLNKNVKRYSRKDLLSCNNSHLGETSSAYVCNDAMNVSRMCDLFDDNNFFIFDDESIRISSVSKMPFRKKPCVSINECSKSNSNKYLPRTVHKWLPKLQTLAEPVAKWIPRVKRCSKHMTGNRALLTNFVEKFLGTVRFGNNDFAVIAGYGDVVIGSMTIKKVYYVKGLGHNLFSVGKFCDKGLEVAFQKSTCFVRNEDGVDLLTDHLCFACEQGKIHRKHHKSKTDFASNKPLYLLHMDLCGPMRVQSINGKRFVLVVVDDYSRYTWVFFLHSKDEASEIHGSVNVNFDEISEMASKQFNLEPGLSKLNETRKSSNPSVSQVSEASRKDLEDLFHNFYDEYFDSSKIMKSSTTNAESSNVEIPSQEEEVFNEVYESFQGESSLSSLNDDVKQSPEEVILPPTNTQSISNNMIPNGDEASTSHNVFNECLEDAYFDVSTSFHDPSNVHTFYQPYPHEKKWTKDHPLHKIIGDPKSSVRTRGQLANLCLFSCLLSSIEPANVAEALKDTDWVSAM
nr:hypothetical protein [Tanacetum cinerariifolium]